MEKQKINCDVHDCKHCDCDCDECTLKKIKVCNCNDSKNKQSTMCNSYEWQKKLGKPNFFMYINWYYML